MIIKWLLNMIQTVLVMRINLFTRLINATKVDAAYSLPADPVVAT